MLNYLVFIAAALIGFLLRQLEIPIPTCWAGFLLPFAVKPFIDQHFLGPSPFATPCWA